MFWAMLCLLAIVRLVFFDVTTRYMDDSGRVDRARLTLHELSATLSCMRDVETGYRGYLITGDRTYLDPFRAGATVEDIEFVQFHPTALFVPNAPRFLLSEALRGEGAYLRNASGERFMERYHPLKELAPRDVVSRSIVLELRASGDSSAFLDLTHLPAGFVRKRFPRIYETCVTYGVDLETTLAPVRPAAHYAMGGVQTDLDGQTTLPRLFAAGEAACTGVHGANRLASNSLLEALVFAHRIYEDAIKNFENNVIPDNIPDWDEKGVQLSNEDILVTHNVREMQKLMNDYVGIVRSDFRLDRALRRLKLLYEETEDFYKKTKLSVKLCELRNLIQVSFIVVKSAMLRKESRGLHYTTDYPEHAEQVQDTVF